MSNLRALHVLAAVAALASLTVALPALDAPGSEWENVARIVAVGDLHGSHDKLIQLLRGAELVDEKLVWTGGVTHLVVAGDFLDRGVDDRPMMDTLRRLQEESAAAGGRVHVLLGNHEVMNLLRDTRDVNDKSYAFYADEETKKDRKAAWTAFAGGGLPGAELREKALLFQEKFPDGYFGRVKLFGHGGEYGDWLVEQPAIVKLNGVVFVHGGLTVEFARLGIPEINRQAREMLSRHLASRAVLENEGIVRPTMRYLDVLGAARVAQARKKNLGPEVTQAVRDVLDTGTHPLFAGLGPFWYRGNSKEDERIERDMLERSLELVGGMSMVVAHSYTGGNRITSRFHGQLFRLDHGILESPKPLALIIEKQDVMVLDSTNRELSRPVPELPYGTPSSTSVAGLSDAEIEDFLLRAAVTDSRELGRGSTRPRLLTLEDGNVKRRAIFKTVERPGDPENPADRYQHEVAAYRLDRLLGLGLVPVTVVREVDGHLGSLQLWAEKAVDLAAAEAYELAVSKAAGTAEQRELAVVFDFLIGNAGRIPSDILCQTGGEGILLIDHSRAFTSVSSVPITSDGLPAVISFAEVPAVELRDDFAEALAALDHDRLLSTMDDLLDEGQIETLLTRRDVILERSAADSPSADAPPAHAVVETP